MQTLDSSHIRYDGVSHSTDCLTICQYNTDLNDVLEALLTFVDTCELTIPTCFTSDAVVPVSVISSPTLNNILQALLNQSCAGQVRVSSDDLCLGQLIEKISSDDGSVAISYPIDGNGCQSIDLSVNTIQTIVQYSNTTTQTLVSTNGTLHQFQYSAGTLENDGEALIVETLLHKNITANSPVTGVYVDGTLIIGSTNLFTIGADNTKAKIRLIRTDNNTITAIVDRVDYSGIYTPVTGAFASIITTVAGLDLDNTNFMIEVKVTTHASCTIDNYYLLVDKFNK